MYTYYIINDGVFMNLRMNIKRLVKMHGYTEEEAIDQVLYEAQLHINMMDKKLSRAFSRLKVYEVNAIMNDEEFVMKRPPTLGEFARKPNP